MKTEKDELDFHIDQSLQEIKLENQMLLRQQAILEARIGKIEIRLNEMNKRHQDLENSLQALKSQENQLASLPSAEQIEILQSRLTRLLPLLARLSPGSFGEQSAT
jgi:hypothetical protein